MNDKKLKELFSRNGEREKIVTHLTRHASWKKCLHGVILASGCARSARQMAQMSSYAEIWDSVAVGNRDIREEAR